MRKPILTCSLLFCLIVSSARMFSQTQPAAGPPASAPATPPPPTKAAVAPLPDPQTPEEFFARARQLSDLEAAGIPFHLKATYVASGDAEFTGNGTYEEWWQSKDLWRKEATLGDFKYVVIRSGGTTSAYATRPYVPLRLRQAMDNVLIRIPDDARASGDWKIQHKNLSGVVLTVVSSKPCMPGKFSTKCGVENYFTSEGVLRIRVVSAVKTIYNGLQPIQNQLVPRAIDVAGVQGSILAISVNLLERLSPDEKILWRGSLPPVVTQFIVPPLPVNGDAGVQAPQVVRSVEPVMPASERRPGLQKTAVIACAIDAKGAVREPYVQASAGAAFDRSALDAVRRYSFIPAKKNGEPVMVIMDISVNFRVY